MPPRPPLRLSEEHVRLVARQIPDQGPYPGLTYSTDEDFAAYVAALLEGRPATGEVWVFAYGSLIWKPACAFVEMRPGYLKGWHRAFCLGWNTRHRGSDEAPGLMLALDRGGSCHGMLYRLPPDAVEEALQQLVRREMGLKPSPFPPRWVRTTSESGPVDAITFCIDRRSGRYVSGLSDDQVADVLARAVGSRGSMVEYLYETVRHLDQLGLYDSHLWRLQDMVAERVDRAYPARRG